MKKLSFILLLLILTLGTELAAQSLYHQWYGPKNAEKTLVFLHGGPGYNSASFELDMAPRLAKAGYQVLAYDQRGCARSAAFTGDYTYAEAVSDLDGLLATLPAEQKVYLLGHSFGGSIAVKYAEAHPEKVAGIVLISAPMDFPKCFRSIQANVRKVMEEKADERGLKSIDALAAMDSTSLEYSGASFSYAMANGLYSPKVEMPTAKKVKKNAAKQQELNAWTKKSSFAPVTGFYKQEQYTQNNHFPLLNELVGKVPVYGIFGDEDGLFTEESLAEIQTVVGGQNMYILYNASHAVFLDDPMGFLDALAEILRN